MVGFEIPGDLGTWRRGTFGTFMISQSRIENLKWGEGAINHILITSGDQDSKGSRWTKGKFILLIVPGTIEYHRVCCFD